MMKVINAKLKINDHVKTIYMVGLIVLLDSFLINCLLHREGCDRESKREGERELEMSSDVLPYSSMLLNHTNPKLSAVELKLALL